MLFSWLVCGIGVLFYAYEYLLRISPSAMEQPLRAHFLLSASGFGLLSSVYYYAYVPMQLPVGILMDRFGPRRLLAFACLICVIGTFMFCQTHSYQVAIIGRFLVGAGSAFAFVGVLKLSTIWLPEDKLAMVAGLTSALGTVGAMFGDNVLLIAVNKVGWQQTDAYTAFFGIGLIFLIWFGIHDHKSDLKSGGTIKKFKQNLQDLNIIIRNQQIWINGLFGCLVYLPTTVLAELWGIPYLSHAHHMSETQAGFANSLLFCGFMIGAPLMGYISDQIKRRKPPMIVGALGAAVIMSIIIFYPDLSYKTIDMLMFSLGLFYSAQAIVFAVGRELSPNKAAGTAIALTNMIVMIGAMLLQPLVGNLLDWSLWFHRNESIFGNYKNQIQSKLHIYSAQDYQFAMAIIPIGILVAALLTYFIRETHAEARD
jgi:MFS family permease